MMQNHRYFNVTDNFFMKRFKRFNYENKYVNRRCNYMYEKHFNYKQFASQSHTQFSPKRNIIHHTICI